MRDRALEKLMRIMAEVETNPELQEEISEAAKERVWEIVKVLSERKGK